MVILQGVYSLNCPGLQARANFNFSSGFTQTAGSLFLNGGSVTGLLTLIGGELTGNGVVDGPLNNTGGVIRPGGTGTTGSITFTDRAEVLLNDPRIQAAYLGE